MIAREDDIITCERGHPLYRITRDIEPREMVRAEQFEAIHPKATPPVAGRTRTPRCPICGSLWFSLSGRIHFEDGWRPRLPPAPPAKE